MATVTYNFSTLSADSKETSSHDSSKRKLFSCVLITPNGKIFEDQIEYLQAPGAEGSFGLLAGHAPFLSVLKKGVITLKKSSQQLLFEVTSGVLEVNSSHHVLILCDKAEKVDSTSRETASAAH